MFGLGPRCALRDCRGRWPMLTEVCVATYELNPALAETYGLEQEDRVVGIVLNPVASAEQIASWQARVTKAIDEDVERRKAAEGVFEELVAKPKALRSLLEWLEQMQNHLGKPHDERAKAEFLIEQVKRLPACANPVVAYAAYRHAIRQKILIKSSRKHRRLTVSCLNTRHSKREQKQPQSIGAT